MEAQDPSIPIPEGYVADLKIKLSEIFTGESECTLCPADGANLVAGGLATLPNTHGMRAAHNSMAILLYGPNDLNQTSLEPLPPDWHEIPEFCISPAALQYIGFNAAMATVIWFGWLSWPPIRPCRELDDNGPVAFINFALKYVGPHLDHADPNNYECSPCMNVYGISDALHLPPTMAVLHRLDPTRCRLFWVKMFMRMHYIALLQIQNTSRRRALLGDSQWQYQSG